MKAYLIKMHLLVPRLRSFAKVEVKYKGYISQKMAVSGAFMFLKHILFFIRRIMGSPVAGVRAGGRRPVLFPEHISKTTLARVMKFHGWIDLIQGECSAQES